MANYTVRKVAPQNTLEHRVYIEKDGVPISPFHDIPLFANQEQTILNMVVEIPRWTNAKLEVRPLLIETCNFGGDWLQLADDTCSEATPAFCLTLLLFTASPFFSRYR